MFVLAHLSDPHLGPLPAPRLAELASKRVLGFVNWYRKRRKLHRPDILAALMRDLEAQSPDHVAVTGDLINIALETEFAPARGFLETLGAPREVTLVPGNHDAYVRAAMPYLATWDEFMRGDDWKAGGPRFPFVRRRGPIALVGLSTAVPTPAFMATGLLGADQLARLPGLLDLLAREARFRVVLIHHPPHDPHPRRHKRLIDADAFRRALAQSGAELVLHGHDHVDSLTWLDGPNGGIPAIGVPSASTPPGGRYEPAAYHLYRIDGAAGAFTCEAVSRGYRADGSGVGELKRYALQPAPAAFTARQ
jgi:3',5'-cyclic AMP phosphodiesterase CpdA